MSDNTSTLSESKKSILSEIRAEGYHKGFSQGSRLAHDESYLKGQRQTYEALCREWKWWWLFGVGCGVGLYGVVDKLL